MVVAVVALVSMQSRVEAFGGGRNMNGFRAKSATIIHKRLQFDVGKSVHLGAEAAFDVQTSFPGAENRRAQILQKRMMRRCTMIETSQLARFS